MVHLTWRVQSAHILMQVFYFIYARIYVLYLYYIVVAQRILVARAVARSRLIDIV